jgi:folate-binding protein YgfZ
MIIQPMPTSIPQSAATPIPAQAAAAFAAEMSGVVDLPHLGVIRVEGEDAVKFLQGQLTQDVALMGSCEAHLAAFCNAKGRMQASFVVFRRGDQEILMVCSRDLLAQTLRRLSMFVLRAKVRLTDASTGFSLFGLIGSAIETIAVGTRPVWAKLDFDAENLVFLYPGAGQARALWCAPAGTPAPQGSRLAPELWDWLEVQSGIAMITLPIFEAFVPQMLNYESVGGVNFKKGCYPGQEVVARSQFRGTLKRRAYVAHCEGKASIGDEIFHARDPEQPCGMVAASAPDPAGGFAVIASMQTSAAADAEPGSLKLGTGSALTLLPLPYPLLDDI